MNYAVLIDFGSTFTKVAAVSLREHRLLFASKFASTVKTDARVGLSQCLDAAREAIGDKAFDDAYKLASSSAAGGLRMTVIGLTQSLSITAGRNAAFGAGAKIMRTLHGKLTAEDADAILAAQTEIVLFCGGYENGNVSTVLHNAKILAESAVHVPIIYAGNSFIAQEVRKILTLAGRECFIVNNVIPEVGVLDVAMAEAVIRDIFMKRIVGMKGLDKVKSSIDGVLMPTPAAVLAAGELLSKGTQNRKGLDDLMIVDIGGATTDIHSFADQTSYEGARILGAREPYKKRTVEGDLGMRESSNTLAEEISTAKLAEQASLCEEAVKKSLEMRVASNHFLADTDEEKRLDAALASGAAGIAARRHAGFLEPMHSISCKAVQRGKNLTKVGCVIGTGGPIVFSLDPASILKNVLADTARERDILLPAKADFFIDADYVLYAAGLINEIDPDAAFDILQSSLRRV